MEPIAKQTIVLENKKLLLKTFDWQQNEIEEKHGKSIYRKLEIVFICTHHQIPRVAADKGFNNTAYRIAKHTESQNG